MSKQESVNCAGGTNMGKDSAGRRCTTRIRFVLLDYYGIGRLQQRVWQDVMKLYCTGHCPGSTNKPQKEVQMLSISLH